MSRRNGNGSKTELKLNISSSRSQSSRRAEYTSPTPSPTSPPSSCVSSDDYSSSPDTSSPMMLVGCPRCLMYVMLSEEDPRCPKCKSTVLLDVFHQQNSTNPNAPPVNTKSKKN